MAVNADTPPIEVHFLDYPDKEINELGARGIGEIGLACVAAEITAAVHHATGVCVRELPIKIRNLNARIDSTNPFLYVMPEPTADSTHYRGFHRFEAAWDWNLDSRTFS